MGATLSSETTAAATGQVGVVRRDPFAMLPFIGYHVGDYLNHWINLGKKSSPDKLPKIFYVNWFRRNKDGDFLWPGYGENSRILKWAIERIEGSTDAVETALGYSPSPGAIDVDGLDVTSSDMAAALMVSREEWLSELPLIDDWFKTIGSKLPAEMNMELEKLRTNVASH
jgi:phosphoenolpyruvate carboxykinase (GTP)